MLRGWILAAGVVLCWGVTFVNTKALLVDFSPLEIQVLRFAVAYAALWAFHPRRGRIPLREEGLFAAMGFTGVAVYQLLENCAIHFTNASNVSILVSTCPVVTGVFSFLLGREKRLSPLFFLGFAIAMAGVVMVSLNGIQAFHFRPLGDLMALTAMLSWSTYSTLVAKSVEKGYPQTLVIRRMFFWTLVYMLPLVGLGLTPAGARLLDGSFAVNLDWEANVRRFSSALNHVNLAFLGLFASAACFVAWNKACAVVGIVRCTVALYLLPAITVLFAFAFLGERLTAVSACGAVLALVGVIVANSRGKGAPDGE